MKRKSLQIKKGMKKIFTCPVIVPSCVTRLTFICSARRVFRYFLGYENHDFFMMIQNLKRYNFQEKFTSAILTKTHIIFLSWPVKIFNQVICQSNVKLKTQFKIYIDIKISYIPAGGSGPVQTLKKKEKLRINFLKLTVADIWKTFG